MDIDSQVNQIVQKIISDIQVGVQAKVYEIVQKQISDQVAKVDIMALFYSGFTEALKNKAYSFPEGSIPSSAVDTANLKISGDNVESGIVKNFGSTGIDDKASKCVLTLFDETTVVENNLLTQDLTVKGTVTVEGNMLVMGQLDEASPMFTRLINAVADNVRSGLNETAYQQYADLVYAKIRDEGVDVSRLRLNGTDIVDGPSLSNTITVSNLQKLGHLHDLQVRGESLMAETFYVTKNRVGVNTIEPTATFDVWDQEVEVTINKVSNGVGFVGSPRNVSLILGTNGKPNITLTPDGAVATSALSIGHTLITSSPTPPNNDQPKGAIVFNSNPSLGGPIGWISLGDARWANFGIID